MTTNAERQAEFKAKMRKQGFALVAEWIPETDRAKFKAYAKELRNAAAVDPAPESGTSNTAPPEPEAKRAPKPDRTEANAKAKVTRERKQAELRQTYDEGELVVYFDKNGERKEGRLLKRRIQTGEVLPPAAITEVLIESSKGSVLKRVFINAWSGDLRLDLDQQIRKVRQHLNTLHPDTGGESADPVAFQAAKEVLNLYRLHA